MEKQKQGVKQSKTPHAHSSFGIPGRRDGSELKSTYCSGRRPKAGSQHPHQAARSYLELQLQKADLSHLLGHMYRDTYLDKNK